MERGRGTAVGGALVLLVGLWARWRVLGSVQGTLNADEAYTGLQAMAIRDGDLPVVIRGAAYTGVVDAYVLAPIHAALGATAVVVTHAEEEAAHLAARTLRIDDVCGPR